MTFTNDKIVTVVVISYNSASTILETLISVKEQSYGAKHIELIISDDASTDNTVKHITEWLTSNNSDFHSTQLITSQKNRGTVKNCNAAWRVATGDWIKTIAGDDVLLPACLACNMEHAKDKADVAVFFSLMAVFFVDSHGHKKITKLSPPIYQQKLLMHASLPELHHYLKYGDIEAAPSAFINRKKLIILGYADERMVLIEDLPLWYKFVKTGCKLDFFPQQTVLYRRSTNSVTNANSQLINMNYFNDLINIDRHIITPDLTHIEFTLRLRKYLWPKVARVIVTLFNNKRTLISKAIFSAVLLIKPNSVKRKLVQITDKISRSLTGY